MSNKLKALASVCFLVASASAQVAPWGQCGGQGWSGATDCQSGWVCTVINPFYSQCLQGTGTTTPTTTTGSTTMTGTSTSTSGGAAPTLLPGYSFIRAVEDPNFHKYLRAQTPNKASNAVLGEPNTAGQFQITSAGQLVQWTPDGTTLYAQVEPRADATVKKLLVSWATTPASTGKFYWNGDTVLWNNPSISRPQENAWYVCPDANGNKLLYVNLGYYSYQTPPGCADETIHAYTGSTPTA